jgi:hypothetical protein
MTSREESEGIVQARQARAIAIPSGANGLVAQTVDERPQTIRRLRRSPTPALQTFTDLSRHAPYGSQSIVPVWAGWSQHIGA